MRNIDKFKIAVPELGDRPDITVVSDAINSVGDAYSGTIEMVRAVRNGNTITISSSRKTERSSFYDGLTIQFVSGFSAVIGDITQVQVDTLPVQQVTFLNDVVEGEFCLLQYSGSSFTCTVVSGKLPDDVMRTGGIDVTGKDLEDKKADRDELYLANAPIGAIMAYTSHVIPIGWLLCDGRTITREDYAELYDLIGDKLPDLRGEFIRGLDNGRGVDSGRELGSSQEQDIENHLHMNLFHDPVYNGLSPANTELNASSALTTMYNTSHGQVKNNFTGAKTGHIDTHLTWDNIMTPRPAETRPRNVALNYIIKASYLSTTVIPVTPAHELNAKIETNYRKQNEAILNNTGKSIGFNGVTYIQDDGEKVVGYLYYDKNSDGLFYCKANTSINYNSADYFEDYSNYANGNKLQNLEESNFLTPIPVVGMSTVFVSKVGRVAILQIDTGSFMKDKYIPGQLLFNIPQSFRPKQRTMFGVISTHSGEIPSYPLVIETNGDVFVYGTVKATQSSTAFYGIITYFI